MRGIVFLFSGGFELVTQISIVEINIHGQQINSCLTRLIFFFVENAMALRSKQYHATLKSSGVLAGPTMGSLMH